MKTILIRALLLTLIIIFCFPYVGYNEEIPVSFRMIINATFRRELIDFENGTSDVRYYTTDRELTNLGIDGTVTEELINGRRYSIYQVLYHGDLYDGKAERDLFIYLRQPVYVEGEENCKSGFLIDYIWIDQYNDRDYPSLMYEISGDYTNLIDATTLTYSLLCPSILDTPSLGYQRRLQGNDRFRNIETIVHCLDQRNLMEARVTIITENIANLCDFPIITANIEDALFEFEDDVWCPAIIEDKEEKIVFTISNKGTQNLVFFDMFINGPQTNLFSIELQGNGNDCDRNTILIPGEKCEVVIKAECHFPKISDMTQNVLVIESNDGNPLRRRTELPLQVRYAKVSTGYGPQLFFLLFRNE